MTESAGKVLMLVENQYPQDPRVRNEAELLTSAGYRVSVICLRKKGQPAAEIVNGVSVYRLPRIEVFKKTPGANPSLAASILLRVRSFLGYVIEYVYFTSACLALSSYVFVRRGFDVIHAHNPPDTLFLVALPFKLLGKKFVFDHHDLCPELYRSRYRAGDGMFTKILRLAEWCSLKLADATIATNESYKQVQINRGNRKPETIFVVRNGPAQERMTPAEPSPKLRGMNKIILCYIGSLNPQDGVDYLLRALRHLVYDLKRKDFHCVIMGSGDSLGDLRLLASELQLNGHVEIPGFVPEEELKENLAAADICVDPDPSSPLNDVSTWIKIMEYMAYSKPIVSFDLKETRFSAGSAALYVEPNNEPAFASAIVQLMDRPDLRKTMGDCGRKRVQEQLQWSVVGKNLLKAYKFVWPYTRKEVTDQVFECLKRLDAWVERKEWRAYDTFDGLSSPAAPFFTLNNPLLKQIWQQGVRRFPLNLRPILRIQPAMSTKGMGFFAQGYLNLYRTYNDPRFLQKARFCLQWLKEHRAPGFRGFCWGNHFDYQSRSGNIAKGHPTIVWSGLIGHAFMDAYDLLQEPEYLEVAKSVCDFTVEELGYTEFPGGICLRYQPGPASDIHNSNMIGASLLARVNAQKPDSRYSKLAEQAVAFTVQHQTAEGGWYYGVADKWKWIDSFHTGYVLEGLDAFCRHSGSNRFHDALRRGYNYYIDTFFGSDGTPRYYDRKMRPLDIQCASQGIQTLINLQRLHPQSVPTAIKVAQWTMANMQDPAGYFYYRKYPLIINKTPTLHWGQATMFAALALLDRCLRDSPGTGAAADASWRASAVLARRGEGFGWATESPSAAV